MIDLNIHFSKDFEAYRVKTCLEKLDWYKAQGYRVDLPQIGVDEGYQEEDFLVYDNLIKDEWPKYRDKLYQALISFNGGEVREIYNINLTKYGVGGSYSYPNTIINNISQHNKDNIVSTIIHEIIHLTIDQLIRKYEIEHWQKERIVDLISLKIFPEKFKRQRDPENVAIIEQEFEANYPNIELIIKNLKK
ncbi:MAG: hypothetical protein NTV48_03660 [Candidatus Vogelbacteria bacterium]|nr:hypothetical protein [Candidatus Vogelbacteria bacterium]